MRTFPIVIAFAISYWLSSDGFALQRYQTLGETSAAVVEEYHTIKEADRVILPGLRPSSAELLMLTLEKRYRRTLGGKSPDDIAKKGVPKIFSDGPSFARARGIYAEFWYAERHPEAGLVSKQNATQNDLYTRPKSQKPPVGIQVKTLTGC